MYMCYIHGATLNDFCTQCPRHTYTPEWLKKGEYPPPTNAGDIIPEKIQQYLKELNDVHNLRIDCLELQLNIGSPKQADFSSGLEEVVKESL